MKHNLNVPAITAGTKHDPNVPGITAGIEHNPNVPAITAGMEHNPALQNRTAHSTESAAYFESCCECRTFFLCEFCTFNTYIINKI